MIPGRISEVIKCPTNCSDHDYYFPHTQIMHRREYEQDGMRYEEVIYFIVCRGCSHWISGAYDCRCRYKCHEEEGGTEVVKTALDAVN
jgi:hypothetical protein